MVNCAKCARPQTEVSVFRFPLKSADRLLEWQQFVGPNFVAGAASRLCHLHFKSNYVSSEIHVNGKLVRRLIGNSVPTIDVPTRHRHKALKRRLNLSALQSAPLADITNAVESSDQILPNDSSCASATSVYQQCDDESVLLDQPHDKEVETSQQMALDTPSPIFIEVNSSELLDCNSFSRNFQTSVASAGFRRLPELKLKCCQDNATPCNIDDGAVPDWSYETKFINITSIKAQRKSVPLDVGKIAKANVKGYSTEPYDLKIFVPTPIFKKGGAETLPEKADPSAPKLKIWLQMSDEEKKIWEENDLECLTNVQRVSVLLKLVVSLKKQNGVLQEGMHNFLNDDQVDRVKLTPGTKTTKKWSAETIGKCLQIYRSVGTTSYNMLVKKAHWPMPCERTLQERTSHIKFPPGIQLPIIQALGSKLLKSKETVDPNGLGLFAILSADEFTHRKAIEYDDSLKINLGNISPDLSSDPPEYCKETAADKTLLVIVRGLCYHWKQIVFYDFVGGKNFSSSKYLFTLGQITIEAYKNNVFIWLWVTDMGPENQGMWKLIGIFANRVDDNCQIEHPADASKTLIVMSDPPHATKNIKGASLKYDIRVLFWFFKLHGLEDLPPETKIQVRKYLTELIEIQAKSHVVLVPGLLKEHLDPSNWEKMRMTFALKIINDKVVVALRMCVARGLMPREALLTAAYIEHLWQWYRIWSARKKYSGLGEAQEFHLDDDDEDDEDDRLLNIFETDLERLEHLRQTIKLMRSIWFEGAGRDWLPSQTAVVLTCRATLLLWKETVQNENCPIEYILPSRLTSEPCENEFSCARSLTGESSPGPLKVKQKFRLDSICQSFSPPRGSCYGDSGDYTALSPEDIPRAPEAETILDLSALEAENFSYEEESEFEKYALHHMGGWVARKALRKVVYKICSQCSEYMTTDQVPSYAWWTDFTSALSQGGLLHSTEDLDIFVRKAEAFFKLFYQQVRTLQRPQLCLAEAFVYHDRNKDVVGQIPICHRASLSKDLAKYYFESRMKKELKDARVALKAKAKIAYAGKTTYMDSVANVAGRGAAPAAGGRKRAFSKTKRKAVKRTQPPAARKQLCPPESGDLGESADDLMSVSDIERMDAEIIEYYSMVPADENSSNQPLKKARSAEEVPQKALDFFRICEDEWSGLVSALNLFFGSEKSRVGMISKASVEVQRQPQNAESAASGDSGGWALLDELQRMIRHGSPDGLIDPSSFIKLLQGFGCQADNHYQDPIFWLSHLATVPSLACLTEQFLGDLLVSRQCIKCQENQTQEHGFFALEISQALSSNFKEKVEYDFNGGCQEPTTCGQCGKSASLLTRWKVQTAPPVILVKTCNLQNGGGTCLSASSIVIEEKNVGVEYAVIAVVLKNEHLPLFSYAQLNADRSYWNLFSEGVLLRLSDEQLCQRYAQNVQIVVLERSH